MTAPRPRRTRTINVESPVNLRSEMDTSSGSTSVVSTSQDAPIVQTTRRVRRSAKSDPAARELPKEG